MFRFRFSFYVSFYVSFSVSFSLIDLCVSRLHPHTHSPTYYKIYFKHHFHKWQLWPNYNFLKPSYSCNFIFRQDHSSLCVFVILFYIYSPSYLLDSLFYLFDSLIHFFFWFFNLFFHFWFFFGYHWKYCYYFGCTKSFAAICFSLYRSIVCDCTNLAINFQFSIFILIF